MGPWGIALCSRAATVGVARWSTASEYLGRIAIAGLAWPLPPEFDDDAALERLLFPDEHRPVSNRPDRVGVAVRAYRTCSSVGRRFRQQQAEAVVRALKAYRLDW